MEMINKKDVELQDTELRLGLPGTQGTKRPFEESTSDVECAAKNTVTPPSKARAIGWPPIRSYRKNCIETVKKEDGGKYVKVSMDGAPYLRKIDMKLYQGYPQLFQSLKDMFQVQVDRKGYNGGDYVPTYEDKDGDWMLVGDVPWEMFINSCKRLRIMKSSEAKGLASSSYN